MIGETFFEIYRDELRRSVTERPEEYAIKAYETAEDYAIRTADAMIGSMRAAGNVDGVHTRSATFARTCKRRGIPYNRAAMNRAIACDLARDPWRIVRAAGEPLRFFVTDRGAAIEPGFETPRDAEAYIRAVSIVRAEPAPVCPAHPWKG